MKVSASVSGGMISAASAFAAFKALANEALLQAVEIAATEIEAKGHADITGAGNFGGRWTEAFKAKVTDGGEGEVRLDVTMTIPYWTVFQFGATINGKPLLYFTPTKAVGGLKGMKTLPTVISKHSVTIPKKFHLIEIATEEADRVPLLFRQKLGAAKEAAKGSPHG